MENPEVYSDKAPSGKESLGEGSADLEKLLQTAEAENLQMVKLIDTERQRSAEFQKQIEETIAKTEQLEESTKNLDVEAKQLHNKFKQNRDICEGLKKTSIVLDEHEEALRKKLEIVSLERQTQHLQHQQDVEKYESIWLSYAKKYENIPMAKELSKIKETTMKTRTSVNEVSEQIKKIQSQIIEMEIEKAHMQEYLQGNPETATESIIKIADMFVGTERSAIKARRKIQELKNMKNTLESGTQKQMETGENVNESIAETESNGNSQVVAEVERAEEHQQRNEVTRRSNLDKYQTMNPREEMATTSHVPTQVGERSEQVTINQVSHQRSDGKQGSYEQQEARKQTSSLGQITTVLQVTTPKTPSSNQHSREEDTPLESPMDQSQQPLCDATSVAPTTPSSTGHVTPANQSAAGTPVNGTSPLDFNKHMQYIRQVTKSPGEGFIYTGRSMYNNNTNNQAQQKEHEENETDARSYEAPLNDQHQQHDISSFNFFQPFEQQEAQNKNLFGQQGCSESSPARPRSIFNMQSTPSNSETSSPAKGFSFGSASPNVEGGTSFLSSSSKQGTSDAEATFSFGTSTSDAGNDFLSSRSPSGNMFGQSSNQDNESFGGGGFSLFGSSSSPNRNEEESPGGFSFNFGGGGKSPSTSNNSPSGFFLF